MRKVSALQHFASGLFGLVGHVVRFMLLGIRSSTALKAENLFLRKQLALYVERKTKPRRASDVTRLTLAFLSRLFAWRTALTIVRPETLIAYGQKTRPGRCPEPEIIAQRTLMINQAREVFCQGRFRHP